MLYFQFVIVYFMYKYWFWIPSFETLILWAQECCGLRRIALTKIIVGHSNRRERCRLDPCHHGMLHHAYDNNVPKYSLIICSRCHYWQSTIVALWKVMRHPSIHYESWRLYLKTLFTCTLIILIISFIFLSSPPPPPRCHYSPCMCFLSHATPISLALCAAPKGGIFVIYIGSISTCTCPMACTAKKTLVSNGQLLGPFCFVYHDMIWTTLSTWKCA